MELPQDPEQLRDYLSDASRRFGQVISRAERENELEQLRRRAGIITEHLETIAQQSTRLQQLGVEDEGREAGSLAESLSGERERLQARIRNLEGGETPEPARSESQLATQAEAPDTVTTDSAPVTAETAEPPAENEQDPVAPQTQSSAEPETRKPGPPVEAESPITPEPPRISEEEIQQRLTEIESGVMNLTHGAEHLDEVELECRINIHAGRARLLQDEAPELRDKDQTDGKRLYHCFGALTRICTDQLVPRGYWVDAVSHSYDTDWLKHIRHWEAQLDDWIREREERQKLALEEAKAQRRREQIEEQNRLAHAELLEELRELLEEDQPDDHEIVELTAELLHFEPAHAPPSDALVELLKDRATLFRQGREFRSLRRAFVKAGALEDTSGRHETVAETTEPEEAEEKQRPAPQRDEFFGWFRGRKGAIVGGTCRTYRRDKLRKYFGFEELEWIENERTEQANAGVIDQRIRNGRYDVVFLLARFCSHKLQDVLKSACKDTGVPFALVERGYGQRQLSRSLRNLGDHLPPQSEG